MRVCFLLAGIVFPFLLLSAVPWHEPGAQFRAVVELRDKNKEGFWLESDWLLPCASGFAPVVHADGQKFGTPARGVIPKNGKNTRRYLYFGFKKQGRRFDVTRGKNVPAVRFLAVEGKDGRKYPLIRRHVEAVVALDREKRAVLYRFTAAQKGEFLVDGEKLPFRILMRSDAKSPLMIRDKSGKWKELPLRSLGNTPGHNLSVMMLSLNVNCNDFMYIGEREPVLFQVRNSSGRNIYYRMHAQFNEGKEKISGDALLKVPENAECGTVKLSSGGVKIDCRQWRTAPLTELPELQWRSGSGFFTPEGERVTVLLTRPEFHLLRKWSMWRTVRYWLTFPKSCLHLREFPAVDPLQNGLLKFYRDLRTSQAVELKLELPPFEAVAAQENWKRERALAALFELITGNTSFLKRTIILPPEQDREDSEYQEWRQCVLRLCREYDLTLR